MLYNINQMGIIHKQPSIIFSGCFQEDQRKTKYIPSFPAE